MAGLLFVYSDPGPDVSHDEFNDWYDNEHVPLRIPIPGFHTWTRWVAADGQRPTYGATYDLASPAVISEPPYAELAGTRSEREKDIIARLGLLDRRTYVLNEQNGPREGRAYDPHRPGPVASVVEIEVRPELEENLDRWYKEEHLALLAKVPGWVRSRRFLLREAGATGSEAQEGKPPKHLAIHEWESTDVFDTAEFKEAVGTEWSKKTLGDTVDFRRRDLKVQRTWRKD
ncbi:hypothetical protein BD413DRAFT_486907 [Trametes elegans]|nr:hypothetical protein BD413DRAFT_486907 [Trametes elegans]